MRKKTYQWAIILACPFLYLLSQLTIFDAKPSIIINCRPAGCIFKFLQQAPDLCSANTFLHEMRNLCFFLHLLLCIPRTGSKCFSSMNRQSIMLQIPYSSMVDCLLIIRIGIDSTQKNPIQRNRQKVDIESKIANNKKMLNNNV